jgi:glycine/D-amino acid oxidase-like deaminating enzyme/nitrite reductase/ring-hydroxylating ferredoxin subunit
MNLATDTFDEGITSGMNKSCWLDTTIKPCPSAPLKENLHADVVIVGGGLAGISVAYCLAVAGKEVVLVEDGQIGSGETGRTTAHIVTALDNRYSALEKIFGEADTRLIAESHKAAINFIEKTVERESIDCQFERVSGYLFRDPSDKEDALTEEYEAAIRAGIEIRKLNSVPGMFNDPGQCLEFLNQAQFHPLLYLDGLCEAIKKKGGKIYAETHAAQINHEGVTTNEGYIIKANHVVIATNTPVNDMVVMHLKQTAFRTYVIGGLVKKDLLPKALWWDTGDHNVDSDFPPYHYIRLLTYDEEYDLLISGGEDHPTGDIGPDDIQEENRYQKLEEWTRQHFPIEDIIYTWSGQVMEPVDSLAFIGRNPLDRDNVYIITGDSGNGMTHCTIGGLLITDMIIGRKNPWEELYDPSRITIKTGDVFFKELVRGIMSIMKGTPQDDRVKDLVKIRPGEAKITNVGGHKCGVYQDEEGEFHIVSARCTHLKATLSWNADEKTWDCPFHGSRFTCDGHVINGPANSNLPVYKESEEYAHVPQEIK